MHRKINMNKSPTVSIIIRTKNEERWIAACLRAVRKQRYQNYEIVLVDNHSTDKTVQKASPFDVKLVNIDAFKPGLAINNGIRASRGEVLVCLSGHCIPVDEYWLENLIVDLQDPQVAGVYGRQQPMSFSSPFDKRDLMLVFGLDRKVQTKDSFFHNANSAFRREFWEKFPFDEEMTNIEDRVWGRQVIQAGYQIVYQPEASVYHYHGINQEMNAARAESVVRIIEMVEGQVHHGQTLVEELDLVVIVPIRGPMSPLVRPLLDHTLEDVRRSQSVNRVVVSTDDPSIAEYAISMGAEAPFLRPKHLSEDFVEIGQVLAYTLEMIEKKDGLPDLVVLMMPTYPFRPPGLIDQMIRQLLDNGLDTLVAGRPESRNVWSSVDGKIVVEDELVSAPRQFRDRSSVIGLTGLGLVTHPLFLRTGDLFGPNTGVFEVEHPFAAIEIRNNMTYAFLQSMLETWSQADV